MTAAVTRKMQGARELRWTKGGCRAEQSHLSLEALPWLFSWEEKSFL